MSSAIISVELPPQSAELIKKLEALPVEFVAAVKLGMDKSLQVVTDRIRVARLTGKGPFPVVEHRLGEVTQQLQRSLRATPAVIEGNQVTASIGSPVFYGAFHEFGTEGRKIITKKGKPGVIGRMPERAPVRTGIAENVEFIQEQIAGELEGILKV